MLITVTWLRLDARRRWRSLAVLALLIALATATILTSIAGARRGESAYTRLQARTLPATVTVLLNQPRFDWAKVAALPQVAALTKFPVVFGFEAQGYTAASTGFPLADDQMARTIERPVILAGRLFNPRRADEVMVTPKFAATSGQGVGDSSPWSWPACGRPIEATTDPPGRRAARRSGCASSGRPAARGPLTRTPQGRPAASSRRPPCSPGTARRCSARTGMPTSTR